MIRSIMKRVGRFLIKQASGAWFLDGASARPGRLLNTDYRTMAREGYSKNVYAFRAINIVAQNTASLQWLLFRERDGVKAEVLSHPILDLIEQPNEQMSQSEFVTAVISILEIGGTAYVIAIGPDENGTGIPRELWVARPDQMRPLRAQGDSSGRIVGWELTQPNGNTRRFDLEQVHVLKTFNPLSNDVGLAPLAVASMAVQQGNEAKQWNISLLQNSARPPGMFTTKDALEDKQFEQLRGEIRKTYQGSMNAGVPFLGEGGMSWQDMGLSPTDMDWLNGQKLSAREIAVTFGVAPELIGDSENKTYSNFKEARKALYEDTIVPLGVWVRGELNGWLVPKFDQTGTLSLDIDRDQIPALQDDRDSVFKRANEAKFLTINEKRHMTGFEDIKGGDVILVSLVEVPLGTPLAPPPEGRGQLMAPALKSYNLDTEDQKTEHWKAIDELRARFNGRIAGMIAAQLQRDVKAVGAAVAASPSPDAAETVVQPTLDAQESEWAQLYARIYMAVGEVFAEREFAKLQAAVGPEIAKQFQAKQEDDVRAIWLEAIRGWAASNVQTRIQGISATTGSRILLSLSEGVSGGEGLLALGDRVSAFGLPDIVSNRSEVIARTEVISASNLGARAGALSTGLPLERHWITSRDGRVRGLDPKDATDHAAMEGQTRAMAVPYDEPRTGEQLMFPGDTSLGAGAANVIQCRCVEGFRVVGAEAV